MSIISSNNLGPAGGVFNPQDMITHGTSARALPLTPEEKRREYLRKWRISHPEQMRESQCKWYAAHPEKVREYRHKREKERSEYVRKWRASHLEQWREYKRKWEASHLEQRHEYNRKWWATHKDEACALRARRWARLHDAPGWDYTTAQHIQWRWEMWGNKCWMCGKDAEATDHFKPLSKRGSHWPANLRPACKSCNSKKHDKA